MANPLDTAEPGTAAVAARLDRLPVTRTHRRATVAVGLGLFFEFYEVFLTGTISAVLVSEFKLSKAALPPLLASTFLGMFFGALLLGRLADRFGRRGAFLLNLALYSFFSLLGAFSGNAIMLLITRFFAGVGLGAEPPLADTYLTDLLPARKRGKLIAWAYTLAFCGVPVVGFLAKGLTEGSFLGIAGWRWLFVIGALGAGVVFLLRRGLPESPRWLHSVGRTQEAETVIRGLEAEAGQAPAEEPAPAPVEKPVRKAAPVRDLFGPTYRRRTIMMTIFHVLQTIGYYGFGTMVPLVLAAKGYPVSQSLLFTALTFLGYPVGSALSLPLVERLERKHLVIGSVLAMAVFGLAFGLANSIALAIVFGFIYTAISNVFSNSYHIYQAEIFPTALRSTASSGTYSISRLASGLMPFVLVPLLDSSGATTLFVVIGAALVLVALDIAILGPRTTGRSVENVAGEG
ncbi:MFS transporter [Amycolatopsis sp. DSM 110486]|uniref:MFS transporter n=1 Tax=Amycolatopsis sp. DSM 110486 TaxID=2865832 RepID=UPI001C6A6C08|nr:MFS transporter [Amycolatopsis sp. DSM 110486]QYN17913.1 MFS transporter [Amycolatopsis sp. DSM 110486]